MGAVWQTAMPNGSDWTATGNGPWADAVAAGIIDGFCVDAGFPRPRYWPGGFLRVIELPVLDGRTVLLLREDAAGEYARSESDLRALAADGAIPADGPGPVLSIGLARASFPLRRIRFAVSHPEASTKLEGWAKNGAELATLTTFLRVNLPAAKIEALSSPIVPSFRLNPGALTPRKRTIGFAMVGAGLLIMLASPFAIHHLSLAGPLAAAGSALAALAFQRRAS